MKMISKEKSQMIKELFGFVVGSFKWNYTKSKKLKR